MPLDPIVSLAVALAEKPKAGVLFVGSGVSADANPPIPTGWQVFLEALGDLYQLVEGTTPPVDDEELLRWRDGHDDLGEHAGYSEVLEVLVPDQGNRRARLEKLFEGVAPGPAHERIADLVADGYVALIVTTNFDRLLEDALRSRGLTPTVITGAASLEAAQPREHVECFVLKVHGDYLEETSRNTPGELESLEEAIETELQQILDRNNVVVLGYAARDAAIVRAFKTRRSRYGLWWLSMTDPVGEPPRTLIDSIGARTIFRPAGAASFLAELQGQLAAYKAHPTGHTPPSVHDEVLGLLKSQDYVGLDEALRRERNAYDAAVASWIERTDRAAVGVVDYAAVSEELHQIFERRLAALIPLALHDKHRFEAEVRALGRACERRRWTQTDLTGSVPQWGAWWATYIAGAILVRNGIWDHLSPLLDVEWVHPKAQIEQYVAGDAGESAFQVSTQITGQGNYMPAWRLLCDHVGQTSWLTERYPELVDTGAAEQALQRFDFINTMTHALRPGSNDIRAHWAIGVGYEANLELVRSLSRDDAALKVIAASADFPAPRGLGYEMFKVVNPHVDDPRGKRLLFIGNSDGNAREVLLAFQKALT